MDFCFQFSGNNIKGECHVRRKIKYQNRGSCDVIVCGGGIAGISADLAAAITDDFGSMSIGKLQNVLRQDGVIIHEKEL